MSITAKYAGISKMRLAFWIGLIYNNTIILRKMDIIQEGLFTRAWYVIV